MEWNGFVVSAASSGWANAMAAVAEGGIAPGEINLDFPLILLFYFVDRPALNLPRCCLYHELHWFLGGRRQSQIVISSTGTALYHASRLPIRAVAVARWRLTASVHSTQTLRDTEIQHKSGVLQKKNRSRSTPAHPSEATGAILVVSRRKHSSSSSTRMRLVGKCRIRVQVQKDTTLDGGAFVRGGATSFTCGFR
jgi:hypothetical protein